MQLIHKDETMVLQRDETAMQTVLEKVSELIEQKDTVFSHLLVDGEEVYENHEQYVNDRLDNIDRIEIVTFKTKEMIWETLQSVNDYFERAVPALNELVDASFDQYTEATWRGISELFEGLEWIVQVKNFTESAEEQPKGWDAFAENFAICEEQFTPMLEAIEAQDTVLISDILAYEIAPAYEELAENVKTMLQDTDYIKEIN